MSASYRELNLEFTMDAYFLDNSMIRRSSGNLRSRVGAEMIGRGLNAPVVVHLDERVVGGPGEPWRRILCHCQRVSDLEHTKFLPSEDPEICTPQETRRLARAAPTIQLASSLQCAANRFPNVRNIMIHIPGKNLTLCSGS